MNAEHTAARHAGTVAKVPLLGNFTSKRSQTPGGFTDVIMAQREKTTFGAEPTMT